MSPKMEASGGVSAGVIEDGSIDSPAAAGTKCASPAPATATAPLVTEATRPADCRESTATPAPTTTTVKRKTCLRISTSPPVEMTPTANKRTTPSNIAATAGSSSVVASKGMLFSRAELRPAPLSASRKYNGNIDCGFQRPSSSSEMMSGSGSSSTSTSSTSSNNNNNNRGSTSLRWRPGGDQVFSSAAGKTSAAGSNFNVGSYSATATAPAVVRPSESFATLRIMEARRRASWTFEPSPRASSASSASPPPPSLAALGTRSTGSYRRRSPRARKGPMPPPLPKMISFPPNSTTTAAAAVAAAAATPPPPPPPPLLPPRHNHNPQLFITAAYGPSRRRVAAAAAAAAKEVVVAPLTDPAGRKADRAGRDTLEQKWAAWQLEKQQENQQGPAPFLGKPAPAAPAIPGSGGTSFGECSGGSGGGGGRKGWGGVGDFHDKVAFLGDYVASVFGRAKRGVSVPQRCDVSCVQVQYAGE